MNVEYRFAVLAVLVEYLHLKRDKTDQTAESEPETAEREQTEETEIIEAALGTRKEYMDRLPEQGMAEYMADEYKSHRLLASDLAFPRNLCKWLSEKADRFGKPMEG